MKTIPFDDRSLLSTLSANDFINSISMSSIYFNPGNSYQSNTQPNISLKDYFVEIGIQLSEEEIELFPLMHMLFGPARSPELIEELKKKEMQVQAFVTKYMNNIMAYQNKYMRQDHFASYMFNVKKRDEILRDTFHVGDGIIKDALMLRFFTAYDGNRGIPDNEKKIMLQDFSTYLSKLTAQDVHDPRWDQLNMYEYGVPLTSCESNFENLFHNWPKWVTNYQQTELLSYEYVETLENSARIEYYADLVNGRKSLGRKVSASFNSSGGGNNSTTYTRELNIEIVPAENEEEKLEEAIRNQPEKEALLRSNLEFHLKTLRESFLTSVYTGDKVYRIKLKIKGQEYEHYVFCRSEGNKVVFDNLFLYVRETKDTLNKLKI
jgi:hypothetical protein